MAELCNTKKNEKKPEQSDEEEPEQSDEEEPEQSDEEEPFESSDEVDTPHESFAQFLLRAKDIERAWAEKQAENLV